MSNLRKKILREYRRLGGGKYREKSGKIVLEGLHLLKEALKAGVEIDAVLFTPEFLQKKANRELLTAAGGKIQLVEVPTRAFQTVAQTENPQGIGAIARLPHSDVSLPALAEKEDTREREQGREHGAFFLILDELQDPGNLGTIIRTAAAAAISGIFLLPGTVDPYNPKALRAGMGGIFYLPVMPVHDIESFLDFLAKREIRLVAADPGGEQPYHALDFSSRSHALIIGNESRGVRASLLRKAKIRAFIPLPGQIAALNAAVAASIFIFENLRQRESRS